MVRSGLIFCAVLLATVPALRADDVHAARDRKARAALALASAGPSAVVAPAPRPVVPKDYATGYRAAAAAEKPLVVFVGCAGHDAPGAVVSYVAQLADVKGPAVVVGFPVGDRLFIHATMSCPVGEAQLQQAIRAATKKINDPAPKELPAPRPLNWDVRADPPALKGGCGPSCACAGARVKPDPRDSLARVRKGTAQGSGTVVHNGEGWSLVLTAAHVVDGPGALTARVGGRTVSAQLVDADQEADLAVLLVPGDFPAVRLAEADVSDGAEVVMYGMTSVLTRGTVSGRAVLNGSENLSYATHADSDSGDSGAGVFHEGRLCGVHLGKMDTGAGATPRAAAPGPVRAFLKRVLSKDVKAAPVLVAPKGDAPGTLRTASGRLLVPTGNGTYRYADEAPAKVLPAPSCPNGRCPLQR
ncbi:MAG TPA: serine protease [Gemmata sp.]